MPELTEEARTKLAEIFYRNYRNRVDVHHAILVGEGRQLRQLPRTFEQLNKASREGILAGVEAIWGIHVTLDFFQDLEKFEQ